ncbi:MAG: DNA mismatch repair protein MutS [Nanoarchaeota archaeon]|nr:DNA mismatch repair protein MutS [Nanoarchaeota archaeon]MBU4352536.1 DNA mismatch repair protein MutS [Nanoarchaeota archaeon]MCG2719840.1 DNA mismatch repair protein MutS [Nanoarchaeota archaeon]
MKQYFEIKQKHPDCILLFRMGDFYETFYNDAITISKELEIVLTSRGKDEKKAPLAGIPYHSLEPYLAKLVRKGYKVAICEQLEDPKLAKGLVKRGVVRIVTPGTVVEDSMLEQKSNNYIMSLFSHADEYAIALCDISTGELLALECEEKQLVDEIIKFNPSECILPLSLTVNQDLLNKLSKIGVFITKFEDRHFIFDIAKLTLLTHFKVDSLEHFEIEDSKLINSCGALLAYLKENQLQGMSHINKIIKLNREDHMTLDAASARNLELIKNLRDGTNRGSLLGVLDKTKTSMGSRRLRSWITSPLLNVNKIKKRLEAVNIFFNNPALREELQLLLKNFADIERILSRINCNNAMPKDILALKYSLKKCPFIKEKFMLPIKILLENKEENNLLLDVYLLEDLSEITNLIQNAIREDAAAVIRDGGVIKPNYHPELNEIYQAKLNSKEFIRNLEAREKERTGIKNLRIGFNRIFGYFIEVSKSNLHLIPQDYIRKQTTSNGERYITEELKKQEELILNAEEKIKVLEIKLYQEIINKISEKTDIIQDIANKIAIIDVLLSFATVATENNYVKPIINESSMIDIYDSRHPVIEKLEKNFVPNDIRIDCNEMMIVTGPNMAGKSTVMRQLALNVLMAQCGSFVPTSRASIGIVDKIFTRVGAHDDLASGQSTFMVEMLEVANILNNATKKSLIILDEIGRGTSTFDGVSIAWAVAEHIYGKIKAKTMFATHYHVLNKLAEQLTYVKNYSVAVKEEDGDIVFLRTLLEGGTDKSYGIHVAKLAGIPQATLVRAAEIQKQLEAEDEMLKKLNAKLHIDQKTLKGL